MITNTKRAAIIAATLAVLAVSQHSLAVDENNTATGLTAAGAPLGFHGVDPVAFLDIQNRLDGSATYTVVHEGVAYYFSSEANADKFSKQPARYTPQNGGFCTFGVSVGKKFDGDPRFADIVDDKLYVFLNEEIYRAYLKDRKGTIRKAEQNWKKIQHTAASAL